MSNLLSESDLLLIQKSWVARYESLLKKYITAEEAYTKIVDAGKTHTNAAELIAQNYARYGAELRGPSPNQVYQELVGMKGKGAPHEEVQTH
ncbi:hypothetical protein N8I74_07400 [Chitiniphilus purpureus]|uniref:Uncharacterized protein n=1 Tax=Chitiniphilus purpureus TaxID=2981137 RepID=A0ABY6DS25_9NEIS|nr:hypothetical protein [Chitiniphilus sp. CD1]UXY16832.1 hypothetical protein N8I74_07400 [Chitiniphilus sp. CD1]